MRRWEAERFSKILVQTTLSHRSSLTKCKFKDKIIKNLVGTQIIKSQVQASSEHGTIYSSTDEPALEVAPEAESGAKKYDLLVLS